VRQLVIKVLNIVDARCNHEVQTARMFNPLKHLSNKVYLTAALT